MSKKEITHKMLLEHLVRDENIADNIEVSEDYDTMENGNTLITMGFQGVSSTRKKGTRCIVLFEFTKEGRLACVEVATKKTKERHWQVASSEKFVDFKPRYGNDEIVILSDRKKLSN
jgi:hypothetical protein